MAPRTTRRQKTNSSHNAANANKGQKYVPKYADDQESVSSGTTATPTTMSSADSDSDWRASTGTNARQETPPSSPAKTSLRSIKNQAKDFVPAIDSEGPPLELNPADLSMLPPPCMPTPGKDTLAAAAHQALGSELWNLNMMDCTDYNGEWFTGVEIMIPALSASNCHLVASEDTEAIEMAQQENQAKAVKSLTKALEDLAPNMVVQQADHRAQVCVEFCAADRDKLCREFSHFCSCPRGDTCRWAHAMIETFMINFILAPLSWGTDREAETNSCTEEPKQARWQPQRPPMPPPVDTQTQKAVEPMKPLQPDNRPKNPKLASKKKWSDMGEDSDDDAPFFFG